MALESQREFGKAGEQFLPTDVLSDIMSRVDGVTLARLSAVSTQFRSGSRDEDHWENLCNQRWPSTKVPPVKTLILTTGGFRKLYNNCFPFISPVHHGQDYHEEEFASAADFVSLVDVTFNGEPVLSRIVDGIPGAGAPCGPLVDILAATSECNDHGVAIYSTNVDDDGPVVTIHTKTMSQAQLQERQDGRFWMALCHQLRVSWLLIHKKTHRSVNLASWKPMSGVQHKRCGDNHFLLRFGSILPNPTSTPIHCSITMQCRPIETSRHPEAAPLAAAVKLADLSLSLEDVYGVHLRGKEALAALARAMACDKTAVASKMASTFHGFIAAQKSNREALIRRARHREKANAVLFVAAMVIILMSHVLV